METSIWTIKTFPMEGFHNDFIRFIEKKWEYFDPMGEHIYLPLTIWAQTKYITPPGDIAEEYEIVLEALNDSGCDMFTLIRNKNWMLGLAHMKKDEIAVLQFDQKNISKEFLEFIEDKYEYRGVDGDHLYSPESIWLNTKKSFTEEIKREYFEICKRVRAEACSMFNF